MPYLNRIHILFFYMAMFLRNKFLILIYKDKNKP